ncbi:RnfABCDGE type electron transport complex subunit B [Sodalis sp. dw_96]|uniref:RnfABCDGE type electron transport complex subunit B n=1 Tax=Sodalis sp. dw_96 TaxID=2719794 RepID=UPI001BD42F5C|nr:RnfABCDGE type electron transport complex subunit B [Sodalis sp. dw_96]
MMNAILPVLAVPAIGMVIGYLLGFAAIYFKVDKDPRIESVVALLPNGQCGQCGFPGCVQAAGAMVRGEAAVSACTPGGAALAKRIAALLDVPLDGADDDGPMVAMISSEFCDGCGRCQKKCNFDAIIGATRQQHGILAEDCTGCAACLSACPQQAIQLRADPLLTPTAAKPRITIREASYV